MILISEKCLCWALLDLKRPPILNEAPNVEPNQRWFCSFVGRPRFQARMNIQKVGPSHVKSIIRGFEADLRKNWPGRQTEK